LYVSESLFVPSFFTLLVLVPVLGVMYHKRIYKYEAAFIVQVLCVLLLTAVLSPGFDYVDQKVLGVAQTLGSVLSGVLLLKLLDDLPRRSVAKILLVLSLVLLAGAALEVAGLLREASDAFREAVYKGGDGQSGYFVYDLDERDAGITGFSRPKLFTSEPSLLAIGFFAFVNSWLLLSYNVRNLVVTGIASLLMLALTGSLVILISLAVSFVIMLYRRSSVVSILIAFGLICGAGLALLFVEPEVAANVSERVSDSFGYFSTIYPSSENIRLVFPFITLVEVLGGSPLFGVGISGKEVIGRYSSLPVDPELALGTNAFATLFIYMGVVGSILFVVAFVTYWRRARVGQIVLLAVLILALCQTMGGFETPRFWGYVFLFAGAVRQGTSSQGPGPRTSPTTRRDGYGSRRPVPGSDLATHH
jgi:hypothetical protein